MAFMEEFQHLKIKLEDIKTATDNFGENKVIGGGGFGKVYIGEVSHSKGRSIVAIKRLDRRHGQGDPEFLKEIMMLSRYKHQNLISLLGFCDEEDEKIIVYEHASRGSLDRHLNSTALTWTQRIKICLDAAIGLRYLHDENGTQQRVLHRDIKSANILLDDKWNAKVSDMGLSKIGPANQTYSYVITNVVGTPGYCDPQYMKTYSLTKESDIYSFGVVLFEVLCGRLCFESSNGHFKVLVPTWKHSYQHKKFAEIIFHGLTQPMDSTSFEAFSDIAFQCLHESREERPTISLVVEKLKIALKSQEISDQRRQWLIYYQENLNGGKKWFYLNAKGEHCEIISIAACLVPYEDEDNSSRYCSDYNSRFTVGSYLAHGKKFKTRIRTQFLSPLITYTVNLVFKCSHKEKSGKQQYVALKYKLKGETKVSIVYLADKKEDEWLIAGLYQFITNQGAVDLEIMFDGNTNVDWFLIDGIEFQPLEHVVVEHHNEEILKAVVPPLIYKSEEELSILLSKGVLLNGGKTWFYLNDNGEHCEMISIEECLIHVAEQDYQYLSNYNSRFAAGAYYALNCKFKTRVRTQFLSTLVTYSVNLVFKFHERENSSKRHIFLEYKLNGETNYSTSYLAYEREDGWLNAELYQFTSNTKTVDLEIIFGVNQGWILIEGIEFQPLEKVEHQVLEDEIEKVDMQTTSDSDAYWEEILPNDYVDIIASRLVFKFLSIIKITKRRSPNGVKWRTKKELYSIIRKGILMDNGEEWLSLDKKGKRCQMLSTRATFVSKDKAYQYSPDSRFGEVLVLEYDGIHLLKDINSQVLSPQTTYASYLVYKLPENQSKYEGPLVVRYNDLKSDEIWYIYLVSPPQTPVIRQKDDENTHNPVNRPKIKGIPQQRSDGWMEVQVWEFQTGTSNEMIHMCLSVTAAGLTLLSGLIIEGIESRSV